MDLIKSPFNVYGIFSYLANGFIFSVVIYFLYFEKENIIEATIQNLTLSVSIILFVIISYIIGHLISMLSSSFFEKLIIKYILRYPSNNLFSEDKTRFKAARKIFGVSFYKVAYSNKLKDKIEKKFKEIFELDFKDLENFNLCFHYVKENSPTTYNRLLIFISIYIFCRNLSLNFLILSVMLLVNCYFLFGFMAIVFSYLFFLRYLKFFRQYGDEVYKTFIILGK